MARLRRRAGLAGSPLRGLRARARAARAAGRVLRAAGHGGPRAAGVRARPRRPARPAARCRRGALERGRFLALDAVLGVEELAGFALSNRPRRRPARGAARVVLVADRFPARGDPLADFARTLAGARVEAAARPEALEQAAARDLTIDYREDDGAAARVAGAGAPGRAPSAALRPRPGRPPSRRRPRLAALAPAVRRLARDGDARVHPLGGEEARAVPRAWPRLAGRRLEDSTDARPGRRPLGVHAALRPRAVRALARAGAEVELVTSRFAYGDGARPRRLRSSASSSTAGPWARRARGRGGSASSRSTCPTCCATAGVAAAADVVHFQWLTLPWLDAAPAPAPPAGAHRARPAPPRAAPGPARRPAAAVRPRRRGDRALASTGGGSSSTGSASTPAKVHVIHHGAFDARGDRAAAPCRGAAGRGAGGA